MLLEEKKEGIYFKLFDMDKYREQRVAEGKDFMIDLDFDFLKISIDEDNNTALITEDTIYSAKRFGPQKHEPPIVQAYRYQCKCGAKIGADNIGEYCVECGTTVKKKDFPMDTMGWIRLPMRALTPLGVQTLRRFMSGNAKREGNKFDKLIQGKKPFSKTDAFYLYDRFEDIVNEHVKKPAFREWLLKNKEMYFIDCLPVISRRFRRFMITKNGDVPVIQADELSIRYTNIISVAKLFRTLPVTEKSMQFVAKHYYENAEALYEKLAYELSDDKEKTIKGEIYSTKNTFSSRTLIEPDASIKLGAGQYCRVGVDIVRTLHKEFIMKYCIDKLGMSVAEADKITNPDYFITKKQKELIRYIVKTERLWIFFNRPPTIDFSGIIALEIYDICDEPIIYVNPIILGLIRGDFDGDTTSDYVLPPALRWRISMVCNPKRYTLWWDRSINGAYGGVNDQVVTACMFLDDKGNPTDVEFLRKIKKKVER